MKCNKCGNEVVVLFTTVECEHCKLVDFISNDIRKQLNKKFVGKPVNVAALKEELTKVLSNLYEETYTFKIEWEEE